MAASSSVRAKRSSSPTSRTFRARNTRMASVEPPGVVK